MPENNNLPTIAVLGGTGSEGGGLALRWAHQGYNVIIGSRQQEKAERAAAELNEKLGKDVVRGMTNPDAAREADIVVLSVPYSAHRPTLESVYNEVQGKILVDVTVPLSPPVWVVSLPEGRTAAEEAQAFLGEGVRVVSAFQNVSAVHLNHLDHEVDCDVLVTGDDEEARQEVIKLVEAVGTRGIDAGPLANAIVAESLTALLIGVNKRYKVKSAGIRITGIG
ncbi:MAG TPA: NADPH-dependent F420 reductase [Aggregatilineales bacterium]|nr:NADPH-dependent F420 reductase [Chloroflexota bacterium]HOA22532.1 NADPH-dependent F420 reductase [Aggregatilineales bacterium]HPV08098.1 NADPH-dependent F420 reductase [Aggregatilineales bacterium]HQA68113.1 NADPH-dependent F420 reductase [Aggregatilineales bacterium]HQE18704.1 NADPH-dependent F420 reductase [Aggregatilineales bacterium]